MSSTRKALYSFVFSISVLVLSGCGGGGRGGNGAAPAPAAATPGNCTAGYVYSPQYGCMNQSGCQTGTARNPQGTCVAVTTVASSCQQTNQGPMVYAGPQYGCLPQNNCPAGQGAYVANNQTTCIPGQAQQGYGTQGYGSSGCPVSQVMTSKGCLPDGVYPCGPGTGFLANRCYPSVSTNSGRNTNPNGTGGIDVDVEISVDAEIDADSYDDEVIYTHKHTTSCKHVDCSPRVKVKRGGRVVKYKYPKNCR